jgi:predicted PurR-regulated permease PerM
MAAQNLQRITDTSRFALIGLMLLASLYTLYFARPILLPLVLTLLLSGILAPAARQLQRWASACLWRAAAGLAACPPALSPCHDTALRISLGQEN